MESWRSVSNTAFTIIELHAEFIDVVCENVLLCVQDSDVHLKIRP